MSSKNCSRHYFRAACRILVMALAASIIALLPPVSSAGAESPLLRPNMSIAQTIATMDLSGAIDADTEFMPYRRVARWTQHSDIWLRTSLPSRGFNVLYLDLNTSIAGNVPQDNVHVYVAGNDDPRTVLELKALRDGMYRLPALPAQGNIVIQAGGMPGVAFAPIIRDETTLSMWDFDGKLWLTAACVIIAVVLFLRAALERSEWRILAAILAMMSSLSVWFDAPVIRNGVLINPASLPTILAPGAILFLYPHIGRLALGLRERGGTFDALFLASSFLSLPLFTLAVPPFSGFMPLIGTWPLAFIPFWLLAVLALIRKLPGSGRYFCMTSLMLVPQCTVIAPLGMISMLTDTGLTNAAVGLVKYLPALSLCLVNLLCLVISFPSQANDAVHGRTTSRQIPEAKAVTPPGDVPPPSIAPVPATESQNPFNLHFIVQSAVESVQETANTKNLVLAWHISPQISSKYVGNQSALSGALLLLLASAIKATKHGQVQLRARRLPESNDPGQLLFSVTDTGVATMPDRDTMALAKAWQWVAAMNGAISMTSDPTGTTVSFAVRFKPEKNEPSSSDASLATSFQTFIGDSPRIIIASSVPNNREMLAYYLDELHYDLREARSTAEVLTMYSQTPGALIIFNDDLPDQDVTRAIASIRDMESKNDYPSTAVLVLVANDRQADHMLQAGCTYTLTTPVTLTMFRHTVLKLAPHAQTVSDKTGEPSAVPPAGVWVKPEFAPRRPHENIPTSTEDAGSEPTPDPVGKDDHTGTGHHSDDTSSASPAPNIPTGSPSDEKVSENDDLSSPPPTTAPTSAVMQDDAASTDAESAERPTSIQAPDQSAVRTASDAHMPISRTAISELAVAKATLSRTGTATHAIEEANNAGKRMYRVPVRPGYVAQGKPVASDSEAAKEGHGFLFKLFHKAPPKAGGGIVLPIEDSPSEWVGEPTPCVAETPHDASPDRDERHDRDDGTPSS